MFKTQIRVSFQYFIHPLTLYFHYKINVFKTRLEQEEAKRRNEKIHRHLKKKRSGSPWSQKKKGYFGQ